MTKSRGILPPRIPWTAAEDALLRERYATTPTATLAQVLSRGIYGVYNRARILGLTKSEAYLNSPEGGRLLEGDARGAACRFPKGNVPANKGLRRPGYGPGRMKATQFQPGTRQGVAMALYKPIGTERISKDGYLERKTHDELPSGICRTEANRLRQRRWRPVHILVWESEHGPLPKGHALAFKNGDKRDIRLDNLECITRAELMKRNTIHNLPTPVARAVQLLGALNRQIRRKAESRGTHN